MADVSWLAREAQQLHTIFTSFFYLLVTVLLLLGVLVEYFKLPLGGDASFSVLVGRVLVAAILLHSYPEVTNLIADVTESVAKQIGDLNNIKLVLSKMGDKIDELTWSWTSVKESVIFLISFISFFALYLSVYIIEAVQLYAWTLLYITSPILIALFVLPATAGATKALYHSLIEIACWKIVWSLLATILWSAVLSKMNQPGSDINFLSAVCFNLMLAGSVLLAPVIVGALAGSGIANLVRNTSGGIAAATAFLTPKALLAAGKMVTRKGYNTSLGVANKLSENYFPKAQSTLQKVPFIREPKRSPVFEWRKSETPQKGRSFSTLKKP
ncbi:MAG: hypothetical protein ABL958_01590 [Bdellovibrionia bacterium]